MAVDDLVLEDTTTPVGFAENINISKPTNELIVTSASQNAAVWSNVASGDYRIEVSSGVTLTRTTTVTYGNIVHLYCPDGVAIIDDRTTSETEIHSLNGSQNVFHGNLRFLQGDGNLSAGNNGYSLIDFSNGADNYYNYHCDVTAAPSSSGASDAPEGFLAWRNNGETAADRYTLHGFATNANFVQRTKSAAVGSNTDGIDNNATRGTFYRYWANPRQRAPIVDFASMDLVNCYWSAGTRLAALQMRNSAVVDIRGCYIADSSPSQEITTDGTASFYCPTSGAGTDNNVFAAGAGVPSPTSASPVVTKPYTLTATTMTTIERDAVQSEKGAGVFTISKVPPITSSPSPNSEVHNFWRAMARSGFREFLFDESIVRLFRLSYNRWLRKENAHPTAERVKMQSRNTFLRWSTPMGGWVEDYRTSYPGLWVPPIYVPERQSF